MQWDKSHLVETRDIMSFKNRGRTLWCSDVSTKTWHGILNKKQKTAKQTDRWRKGRISGSGRIIERGGKIFQGWCVWNDNCCLPSTPPSTPPALSLSSSLYQIPLSHLWALQWPQVFQPPTPLSLSLCTFQDKYRTLYSFRMSCDTPPNYTWERTVYIKAGDL